MAPKKKFRNKGHTEFAALDRQQRVSRMYLQGYKQHEIAESEGVTQAQISNDLNDLRTMWLASSLINIDERKAQELAKIDHIEATCWEEYERSKLDAEASHRKLEKVKEVTVPPNTKRGKGRTQSQQGESRMVVVKEIEDSSKKGRLGDVRYLEQIAWCIETRMKICGLLVERSEAGKGTVSNWDALYGRDDIIDPIEVKILGASRPALEAPQQMNGNGANGDTHPPVNGGNNGN